MCGIAGLYSSFGDLGSHHGTLRQMLSQINHRGPDECGILTSPHVLMGNVRLNIIDLKGGTQPIADQSERFWIVFNGEIYNYLELRDDLEKKGYSFKTRSDTEVLVQLYAVYGEACLSKLNGQFAFAIWDEKTGDLFLARDRVGIRPLFYTYAKDTFVFASEIKSLLKYPEITPSINVEAMHQIFTYWSPLTPNTVFNDIYELPPGHYALVKRGRLSIQKYWEVSFSDVTNISTSQALEEFEYLLHDAVKLRLRSDVPVAAYLSGGIDSAATTWFIKEIQPNNLQTFSIGFQENQYDETAYQNEASTYLNTSHKQFICNNDDISEIFAKVIWHAEVPVLRTAPAPMFLLSRMVRDNDIKVVITGEGADEMLGGYNIFKEALIRNFWAKDPDSKYRPLLLKKLYPYIPYIKNANPGILKMFFGYQLESTSSPFYSHLIRWNNTSRLKGYLSSDFLNGHTSNGSIDKLQARLPDGFNSWSSLAKAQWLEINLFMSGYLLSSQGDRMAMANSVEGRYPFLDHRLIELCASLPQEMKLNGLTEKYLLKKLMANRLPDSIVKRSKQAYRAPISHMINGLNSSERIKDSLSGSNIKKYGLFDQARVEGLKQKYDRGQNVSELDDMALIAMISTQLLYEQFIDNNISSNNGSTKMKVKKHVAR